jgi:hypothetical protein
MDGHRLFVLWRSAVEVANQKTTMIAATCAAFGGMQQIWPNNPADLDMEVGELKRNCIRLGDFPE